MPTPLRVLKFFLVENGVRYAPGQIFLHPDDARAKVLLSHTPPKVVEPNVADYVDYAERADKAGVEVPDFVVEFLKANRTKAQAAKAAKGKATKGKAEKAAAGEEDDED